MLNVVNANEVVNKIIQIVLRAKLDHLSGAEYEEERDRLELVHIQIQEKMKEYQLSRDFCGLKIVDRGEFIHQIVGKVDKSLSAYAFIMLQGDIVGVYA